MLLASYAGAAESDAIPKAFGEDRYATIKKKSPFALATPVVAAQAPFVQGMFVTGLGKIGEDIVVTITNADKKSFTLETGKESPEGISIVGVEWSDEPGKTKVNVKKGNEFGTLQFNEQVVRSPIIVNQAPTQGQQPRGGGRRGPNDNNRAAAAAAAAAAASGAPGTPTVRRRPIIRRPSR